MLPGIPELPGLGCPVVGWLTRRILFFRLSHTCDHVGPEGVEREGNDVEGRTRDRCVIGERRQKQPLPLAQGKSLKRPCIGIHEPEMANAFAGIERPLIVQVQPPCEGERTSQTQSGAIVK